jgi:hypothetical protein
MRVLSPLAALVLAVLASGVALALSPGTNLSGQINQTIDTGHAYVGQMVTISNVSAPGANIYNATMYGTVTKVVSAGQGRPAQLRITLNRLRLSNGTMYTIVGVVTGWNAVTKNNTLKEVAGAVGGMLVGNVLGKWIFHGASGGGLVGAAGGYLTAKNNRSNMVVSQGSTVQVQLVSARRQTGH